MLSQRLRHSIPGQAGNAAGHALRPVPLQPCLPRRVPFSSRPCSSQLKPHSIHRRDRHILRAREVRLQSVRAGIGSVLISKPISCQSTSANSSSIIAAVPVGACQHVHACLRASSYLIVAHIATWSKQVPDLIQPVCKPTSAAAHIPVLQFCSYQKQL